MAYTCTTCGESFQKKSEVLKHQRTENHWLQHKCKECGKVFNRKDNLDRHMERHKDDSQYQCPNCARVFARSDYLQQHLRNVHNQTGGAKKRKHEGDAGPAPKRVLLSTDTPKDFYDLKKIKEETMAKFNTTSSTYKVKFKDIEVEGIPDILTTLKRLFKSIIEDVTHWTEPRDLIRLSVQCPQLDFPVSIPFMRREQLNAELLLSEIERVLQSYQEFVLDNTLEIDVIHVKMPVGGKWMTQNYVNLEKMLRDKQCIIQIKNTDELCCARAIVTATAKIDKHEKWNSIRQGNSIQKELAEDLHVRAGVPLGKCGIDEVKKFQAALPDYQINVVSRDHFNAIVYSGPETDRRIYVYLYDEHYAVITSMPSFLNRSYFCTKCHKGYDHVETHKCNNACVCCRKIHTSTGDWVHCEDCNRYFRGQECHDLHKKTTEKGNSTCKTLYKCHQCDRTVNRYMDKKHICGNTYCHVCKDFVPEGHMCYMKVTTLKENTDTKYGHTNTLDEKKAESGEEISARNIYIFYDLECTQDDVLECDMGYVPDPDTAKCKNCRKSRCGSYEHIPNLCVAHKVCDECLEEDVTSESECLHCGENERVFSGPNTTQEFCQWLFSGENQGAIVLAHNFKGYDSYPILQYLYRNGIKPVVIPNGAKIMSLIVPDCKIKFLDSMNFLPTALSKLPDMFKIDELCKGYFPHLYNRKENQTKVLDHLPDAMFYNPDGMKGEDRAKFYAWYKQHENDRFDFQEQLLTYCKSDVDILRRCSLRFRDLFMETTRINADDIPIDPFDHCCTIASACQLVFRTRFLQPESIGIIPHHGYRPEEKQSMKALQWINYLSHKSGQRIQHARNGVEKKIGKYWLDGYYETEDGETVVLEFHGCFWHGCPQCYSRHTKNPICDMSMADLHERTLEKQRYLESLGYTYICKWEHEFCKELEENTEMRRFVNQLEFVTPLEPRDAFFGGRTEAFTLFKEASPDESIDYYDVTSLYPWVNKTGKVPLGHPDIVTEDFKEIERYEGLVKCQILPPRGVYIPVLPAKINGKLLFSLCKTCAETSQQLRCQHVDEDRAFTGTWVTDEVKKAVERGYKIVKIYEVWHFEQVAQYDPVNKTGGVFTEYVNTFLKMKQEASGWPQWCTTEEDKQRYIEDYHVKEGIWLDYENIKKNPGLRSLAKLMLNSFWGKFGQRSNMPQVKYVADPAEYFDLLTSDEQEVLGVHFVNQDMVEMRVKNKDDFVETSDKTNVVIAAYTTAQARLKLYTYLETLKERALYADTDSVVYTTQDGQDKLPLGDYLGDLTNEVPNGKIKAFVTGGPKNYAYQVEQANQEGHTSISTECKVRGITLNYRNALKINFDTVKRLVTGPQHETVTVKDDYKICRENTTKTLLTTRQDKDYRIVFDKRIMTNDPRTLPYGY